MTQYSNRSGEGDRDSCNLQVRSNVSSNTPRVATTSLLPPKDEGHYKGRLKTLSLLLQVILFTVLLYELSFQEVGC